MPRVRPHFKIHVSIQNHRRAIGVYESDALLAMFARIGIMAIERFADRTGDSFLCSGLDLERLAGCRGVANARRKLGRLEASTRLRVGQEGAAWSLSMPNFGKKQGFYDRNVDGIEDSPTPTPTPTPKKSRAPRSPLSGWSLECSDLLIELLRPVPGAVIPQKARDSWAREIERLSREAPELSANGADPRRHIEGAIRWALGPSNLDQEYEVVIRSGRSLREKWPKLRAAAKRAESKRQPSQADFASELYDATKGKY